MFIYEHKHNDTITKVLVNRISATRLKFSKSIHNNFKHIERDVNKDITMLELEKLCKIIATLDNSFFTNYDTIA